MARKTRRSPWVSGAEMKSELNCDARHLKTLRENGTWQQGSHWRAINPKAVRLTYQYHKENCLKDLVV